MKSDNFILLSRNVKLLEIFNKAHYSNNIKKTQLYSTNKANEKTWPGNNRSATGIYEHETCCEKGNKSVRGLH